MIHGKEPKQKMKRLLSLTLILLVAICPLFHAFAVETLDVGSTGDAVTALQQQLSLLGLSAGKADGIYGKQTASAVIEAQRLLVAAGYKVPQTGTADADTLALLFDKSAEDALRTLRFESRGDRVRELQARLIDLKLLTGAADGVYGSATQNAVLLFQQRMTELGVEGLNSDGVATPPLVALLMSDLSQYGFQAPIYFDESAPLTLTADDLYATACLVMDAPSGSILFAHAADERRYPASTTKMMTLLLAIESGRLDETVIVPQSAADIPQDSSLVPVYPGEEMQMRDLLHGLMIRSGNDAANAVAELCAGGIDAFVAKMNQRAHELGMTKTHFVNPHGYHDSDHYSTARDLAILARQGLTDATFCEIATCLYYTLPATDQREPLVLQNSYEIFRPDSEYYIPGAAGVKSGYTSYAGFCYVGAAQRDGRTMIAVVLGVPTRNRAWMDLRRLFAYGFASQV